MKLHIGKIIREHLEKTGMNKSEFARRLNTSPQNVYGIFKRQTIDTSLLQKISEILGINFFQYYYPEKIKISTVNEAEKEYGQKAEVSELKKRLSVLENRNTELEKEVVYLKEIVNLLKSEKNTKKQ